jgi:ABC-type oligopeptide transport system ATPase subunit
LFSDFFRNRYRKAFYNEKGTMTEVSKHHFKCILLIDGLKIHKTKIEKQKEINKSLIMVGNLIHSSIAGRISDQIERKGKKIS